MDDLAARANCSNSTIRDFEAGRRVPHRNRLGPIRQALEVAGIVFTGEEGAVIAGIAGPVEKPHGDGSRAVSVKKGPPPSRKRKPGGGKKRG